MLMSRGGYLALVWLAVSSLLASGQTPPPAQPVAKAPAPADKLVRDDWDIAYLDGHRVGYVRLFVEEKTHQSGVKIFRASRELNLTVRRGQDLARIQAVTGTDELADGRVLGVFMRQGLGTQVEQELIGKVEDKQLRVKAVGKQANFERLIPWNPAVVGTLGELNLLKNRKPQPGDRFDYLTFEPTIDQIVTVRIVVDSYEDVSIAGQRPKLLRVSATPDMIAGAQLPSQVLWFDANYEIRRTMTSLPGFGFLVVERSDKAKATQALAPNQLPDIMERQSIKLNRRLPGAYDLQNVVYRITLTNEREPAKAFALDGRQTIRAAQGQTIEMQVQALRSPPTMIPVGAAADPGAEFLKSNFFITSDDDRVKQHARIAVGDETDPWRKAQRIEKWVNGNMKVQNFSEAMVPAFKVAETLTGDCTEYSMLAAAMCRAAGVPSRIAIGLIYVEPPLPQKAYLGFHMWTEVYVRGAWVAIDATLGRGSVGAAHLKISDHSWHETPALTPLLPLMRVLLAQPAVEIVEWK